MRMLTVRDQKFFFGHMYGSEGTDYPEIQTCGFCGTRYNDHGLCVYMQPERREGAWGGEICGECLRSGTKRLALIAREYSPILRKKRPPDGDDEDSYIVLADDLLRLADLFDTLDSLDAIEGGLFARKIGEAYRELDNRSKARKGKAA